MDEEAGKIVVSEREAMAEERAKALENLTIGDTKDGMVSGIVKFGLFVAFDGLEGLVHISEIAWGHVKNPSEFAEVGDKVKVKIIGIDGDKLCLSVSSNSRKIHGRKSPSATPSARKCRERSFVLRITALS